jgi:hypothetical protein
MNFNKSNSSRALLVATSTSAGIVGLLPPASARGNGIARRSDAQTNLVSDISGLAANDRSLTHGSK